MAKAKSKSQKLPKVGRAVIVRWHDIATDHGWQEAGLKPATCVSVGLVADVAEYEGKKVLELASMHGTSAAGEIEINSKHAVPAGCIISWAYLVEAPSEVAVKIPLTQPKAPATVAK